MRISIALITVATMPRNRWFLPRAGRTVRSLNPWAGAGFGLELKDDGSEKFFGFPIAGGIHVELGLGAFLTAEGA